MALFRGGLKSEKMQTDYLFNGIKGYAYIKRFSYLFEMKNKEANERYKILKFFDKYGLNATIEAFNVSGMGIFTLKKNVLKLKILTMKYIKPISVLVK